MWRRAGYRAAITAAPSLRARAAEKGFAGSSGCTCSHRAFARSTLGPLLEHDRERGSELIRTLRVYLDEDRRQRRTAARLFIHPNTVAYRVDRIESLLGRSLADPSTVFEVTLALRTRDVVDGG